MGIDTEGGMLIGRHGTDVIGVVDTGGDEFYEWAEANGLEKYSEHYDSDEETGWYGFPVPDVPISEMDGEWRADVDKKAAMFEKLTGLRAMLVGTQNVW